MGKMDKDYYGDESDEPLNSVILEENIRNEFASKQVVASHIYPLDSTSIIFPEIKGTRLKERRLKFNATDDPDKRLIYRTIVAAYNYAYVNEFAAKSAKIVVEQYAISFVEWLNKNDIGNRYTVLKEYEIYCFDLLGTHGGYSVLNKLKPIFTYAFEYDEFRINLTASESKYLRVLKETRISPNYNKKQISLASYFGELGWLRRKDGGVGDQLYNALASAKFTVKSLKYSASVVIIDLFKIKVALRKFLVAGRFTAKDFQFYDSSALTVTEKKVFIGQAIYRLVKNFHSSNEKPVELRNALDLLLLSNVTNLSNYEKLRPVLDGEKYFDEIFHIKHDDNKSRISTRVAERKITNSTSHGVLLSMDVIAQLSDEERPLPITEMETLMFNWLMASLTVQPSDIPKLSRSSFRQLIVGGRVRHIECEYFKGRSNAIHNTRMLSTKKPEGEALVVYLEQHLDEEVCAFKAGTPFILSGLRSVFGSLVAVLEMPFIAKHLAKLHLQIGDSPIILPSVLKALQLSPKLPVNKKLFGLQAIKNSAVHAYADPYTLHYLINRNSHSNKTEKFNYLTPDNEEFINACGRITRSIMIDLINNVFYLDFQEPNELGQSSKEIKKKNKLFETKKAEFNNEFSNVANSISYQSEELLSRLRVVTEQSKGVINEVGILSFSNTRKDTFAPIYVLDSKITVLKMLNYLNEFKKNYRKLLCRNPDYLYLTVFPYVEWIETVLTKLSKSSISDGEILYNNMKKNGVTLSVFHSI